jgi:hypothetical protein
MAAVTGDPNAQDRFPYPQGSVVGVLRDDAAVAAARERLEQAGFGPDRYDVLHGDAGLARIDVEGDAHGLGGAIRRKLQSVLSDDADHVRRYADALRDGDYVVGVDVGEDEAARRQAADALRAAGAESIDFYAENYVEDLTGG